ncbi:MAG: ATP-dependent Clp protease proteolytic subunit [Chlorobiota bacterium]|nr:ATP-dependent Clp protease proteolytic subunit [Chlorobiota bacterium]QQS65776.1 MAG: ATP-dependent Clp protease proteolytic subunit [Chlorobiota bacterium]
MKSFKILTVIILCLNYCISIAQTDTNRNLKLNPSISKIYILEIKNEVDLAMSMYVKRGILEAENNNANGILLHINTFGGRLDAATDIKDALLNTKINVYSFVDKRAISAGSLICLTAKKIAMSQGSSIGAATPVLGDGVKASEKVVSYMRGEMRSTAQKNNRNPIIAEAMVDENISLNDSLKKVGQLLTLTTDEAVGVGYCDTVAIDIIDALNKFGVNNSVLVKVDSSWDETLIRIVTKPFVNSLLIMLGLGGLFYGIKTGHFGVIAAVGFLSLALFFGAQYIVKLTNVIEIAMFVVGVLLLILEIFIIPGVGVTGFAGVLLVISSIFLAMLGSFNLVDSNTLKGPIYSLAGGFVGFSIIIYFIIKYMPTSKAFGMLTLQTVQSSKDGFLAVEDFKSMIGKSGIVISTLRPAGVAMFDSKKYDVVSEGDFINKKEKVEIIQIEGRRIVVRKNIPF